MGLNNFNPRSLAGATPRSKFNRSHGLFQSTLPRGSDCRSSCQIVITSAISIHAPSRERRRSASAPSLYRYFNPRSLAGATAACGRASFWPSNFNPRSLAGATKVSCSDDALTAFQSTLPRGSDKACTRIRACTSLFQSTLPRGSDGTRPLTPAAPDISIHAPSRERRLVILSSSRLRLFQSTLPRGSDLCSGELYQQTLISIHAPSRERHFEPLQKQVDELKFQSTLPRGSDG